MRSEGRNILVRKKRNRLLADFDALRIKAGLNDSSRNRGESRK
jgi:hypothetical protein